MTNPELQPDFEQDLREKSDLKASAEMGRFDKYANTYIDVLLQDEAKSPELSHRAIELVSRIVGWSSKNADTETGCVPIANLSTSDTQDVRLDKLVVGFLSGSPDIEKEQDVSETHTIDRFKFNQPRQSGNLQAVIVHRKSPLEPTKDERVEYFIKFTDLGKPHPFPEAFLEHGRRWLESTLPAKVAQAAMETTQAAMESTLEKTQGVKQRVKKLGRSLVFAVHSEESTTEDS